MIVVTGAYGFIGSNLVKELNKQGYTNLVLVDDLTQGDKYKNLLGADFHSYYDVDNFLSDFKSWADVKAVYHQGAISSTVETNGKLMLERNYTFSSKLFDQVINWRIPISYASSASVYGNKTDGTLDPLNLYAYSKMLVDTLVLKKIDQFKLIQGWRYFNVYGKNETHKLGQASPITTFKHQIEETGYVKIFEGSENIYRDFVCVDDVVNVVIDSMQASTKSGIRDLGTGIPLSFANIAEYVTKRYGGEITTIPFPAQLKQGYQYYTKAKMDLPYKFSTVSEWLDSN